MNAVEIEQALSDLAEQEFDKAEFPFQFLAAFGNKATTIARLRKGDSNTSDLSGGVLQRNHIHIVVADPGKVGQTLTALKASQKTAQAKAKFILATDGTTLESEELATGDAIACDFPKFPDHFGFFLPLAGISTIKEIKDNPIDVRATGRLNKLYIELLRENPDWATFERRPDMNHFMARLVFCFFAEDTDMFPGTSLFTTTMDRMSERDGSNVHEVLEAIFLAMNTKKDARAAITLPRWATEFPYVNGGLFSGSTEVPKFTRTARSYLYQAGQLDWRAINPDIFGSMIQAVADDEERGALGMHYTSVPNILKVLNPLFLNALRTQLVAAGNNKIKLLNLRKRMAHIRVFDPACGSGNFLVIAYKQMREIEAKINQLRGEANLASEIPINNFRGIEFRDFPAEIARLALIIAEFQCDVLYRGQKEALTDVLPLDSQNWITCGNALRLDWLAICPPTGTGVKLVGDDLFNTPLDQSEIDFDNEGGEIYVCGNPPYSGKGKLTAEQKADMAAVFQNRTKHWGYIDYVGAWFIKAYDYCDVSQASVAFVATNSVVMGRQAPVLWPLVLTKGVKIRFAHTSFGWSNNATRNAAVFCVIVGFDKDNSTDRFIFTGESVRQVEEISHYLTAGAAPLVEPRGTPISESSFEMVLGNMPNEGGALSLTFEQREEFFRRDQKAMNFIRRFYGSKEFNNDLVRYCLWISDENLEAAAAVTEIRERISQSKQARLESPDAGNRKLASRPHQMREFNEAEKHSLVIPRMTSERREFLPCGLVAEGSIISSQAFAIFDADIYVLAILLSRVHFVWVATICGKFKEDYRYSNDLGWNTFPLPTLTEQNKVDLTACAQEILLAREAHYPANIAGLYDPDDMPDDLRRAHEKNDETLDRIYIGRKFKNDTERLEKLFDLYIKMTANQAKPKKGKAR